MIAGLPNEKLPVKKRDYTPRWTIGPYDLVPVLINGIVKMVCYNQELEDNTYATVPHPAAAVLSSDGKEGSRSKRKRSCEPEAGPNRKAKSGVNRELANLRTPTSGLADFAELDSLTYGS